MTVVGSIAKANERNENKRVINIVMVELPILMVDLVEEESQKTVVMRMKKIDVRKRGVFIYVILKMVLNSLIPGNSRQFRTYEALHPTKEALNYRKYASRLPEREDAALDWYQPGIYNPKER